MQEKFVALQQIYSRPWSPSFNGPATTAAFNA
jgi:hypothetical protein